MSSLNQSNVVSLNVKEFPQNLIIPGEINKVLLQISNNSNKQEKFLIEFKGEMLDVKVMTPGLENEVQFNAGETKDVQLSLIPSADGAGKLIINVYWIELVEYFVKVQQVREKASGNNLRKILKNTSVLPSEVIPSFDPDDFFYETSKEEIKQIDKGIKLLKQELNSSQASEDLELKLREIDAEVKKLAKGYLYSNDFYKALETSLEILNEEEKIPFYYHLLRAYASRDLEATLEVVRNLGDLKQKDQVLVEICIDLFEKKPEEMFKIITLIDNKDSKEKVLLNVINRAIESNNVQVALKYSQLLGDSIIRIKALFNIIKSLNENNNKGIILPILNQINQLILNSDSVLSSDSDTQTTTFKFLKDSICIIAELDCPESADSLIKDIKQEDLRTKITKELFNEIYEMVDEKRTRLEKKVALSQFYTANAYSSKVTREIKTFSQIGGNVSNNILMRDYNFNLAFISLFSFNFSIFPIIDRLYSDFYFNLNRSFAYYIFPSISGLDQGELNIIQQTITQFFNPRQMANQIILFNLDFIPYLGKPTVILAEDQAIFQDIKTKLDKYMKGEAEILINEDFFKGGQTFSMLNSIFNGRNFTVVNLILSYEFLNNYEIFKKFIEALI